MPAPDDEQSIRRLEFMLDNAGRWNAFAETKNAALLAASATALFGLTQASSNFIAGPKCVQIWFFLALGQLALVALLCVLSFLPRLRPHNAPTTDGVAPEAANLLYVGDVGRLTPSTYLKLLGFSDQDLTSNRYAVDLAKQVSSISQIGQRKYLFFNVSAFLIIGAILTPLAIPLALLARRAGVI